MILGLTAVLPTYSSCIEALSSLSTTDTTATCVPNYYPPLHLLPQLPLFCLSLCVCLSLWVLVCTLLLPTSSPRTAAPAPLPLCITAEKCWIPARREKVCVLCVGQRLMCAGQRLNSCLSVFVPGYRSYLIFWTDHVYFLSHIPHIPHNGASELTTFTLKLTAYNTPVQWKRELLNGAISRRVLVGM